MVFTLWVNCIDVCMNNSLIQVIILFVGANSSKQDLLQKFVSFQHFTALSNELCYSSIIFIFYLIGFGFRVICWKATVSHGFPWVVLRCYKSCC